MTYAEIQVGSNNTIGKKYITNENSNYFRIKIKYIDKKNIKVSPE